MGMLSTRVHHVQKTKVFYSSKVQVSPPYFQSRLHMKRVFCQGLAASNIRDHRSYAAVAAAGISSGSSMVSGLLPLKAFSSDEHPTTPVTNHKVTMCNDDRNINAASTGTGKHALNTRSFHKRTVGQGHTDTSGQVLPVHNRFMALCSDFRTQDTDSIRDKVVHSSQSTQTPKLASQSNADTANMTKASTSTYFQHSSCYSSHNTTHESRELGSKFGCLTLSPVLLYNGDPKHRSEVLDVLQAHRLIRQSGVPNFWALEFWSRHN